MSGCRALAAGPYVGPKLTRSSAPPPGAFCASAKPPLASAAWRTIASPSPEPGSLRALLGAVEAVEHERQVRLLEARAVVADASAPRRCSAISTIPPGGLHLRAFSSRFETARSIAVGLSAHDRRLEVELEAQIAAPPRALDRVLDDLVQAHVVRGGSPRPAPARELDDVADQRGQLVELLDDVPPQALLLLRRQPLGFAEDLDVRAQRGDRRAQLVARVGDQVALGLRPSARARRASR